MSMEMNKALDLLREIRPSISKEVLELWCKDRDAFLASHPAVEQAGGDERAAFEAWMTWLMDHVYGRLPDFTLDDGSGAHYVNADVSYAWTAWQARAALAQPYPAQAEAERPELEPHIPAQTIAEAAIEQLIKSGAKHYQEFHFDLHLDGHEGARPVVVTVAFSDGPSAHELRMKAEQERDEHAKRLEVALARVAELEKQEPVATVAKVPGEDWNSLDFHRDLQHMQPGTKLYAAPVARAQHSVPELLEWAVDRWHAEVSLRPLINVHRRALDDTWRQVIRHLGGDTGLLCGPSHDELLAAAPGKEGV